jgi:hypothetical protein
MSSMDAASGTPTATIWTDGPQAAVVMQILEQLGPDCRVIGVGGPRVSEVDDLARALSVRREDDLRKLLVENRSPFVLLATMADVARDDLAMAVGFGATVLTLEPAAAGFDDLKPPTKTRGADKVQQGRLLLAPSFLRSAGWLSAAQPQQVLGQTQLIGFTSLGQPREGSLFARLADAWSVLLSLAPMPQMVHAAMSGPMATVADDLRGATGHLAVQARWATNLAASLQISDRAGLSVRRLHVLGSEGHLVVGERDYRLHDSAGKLLDHLDSDAAPPPYAQLVAEDWRLLIRQPPAAPPPDQVRLHEARVLACCLACLLSARTMQPESPEKVLKMEAA